MTTGLLTALKELGTHIPDDVSLISFDDLPYFVLVEHPITAIAQAAYEIGQRACDLLLDLITGGTTRDTQIRLPCSLMIRDSCRPIDTLSEDAMSTA
jgi:DNA-binding LacI/PurR family transcriptional regulator